MTDSSEKTVSYSEACAVVMTIMLWEHTRLIENTKDAGKFKRRNQVTETLQAHVSPADVINTLYTRSSDDIAYTLSTNIFSRVLNEITSPSKYKPTQLNRAQCS